MAKATMEPTQLELICRVCLVPIDIKKMSFGFIHENASALKSMVMSCLPEMDLYVSANPVVCHPCIESLGKLYSFKNKCINTETHIRSYRKRHNIPDDGQVHLKYVLNYVQLNNKPRTVTNANGYPYQDQCELTEPVETITVPVKVNRHVPLKPPPLQPIPNTAPPPLVVTPRPAPKQRKQVKSDSKSKPSKNLKILFKPQLRQLLENVTNHNTVESSTAPDMSRLNEEHNYPKATNDCPSTSISVAPIDPLAIEPSKTELIMPKRLNKKKKAKLLVKIPKGLVSIPKGESSTCDKNRINSGMVGDQHKG